MIFDPGTEETPCQRPGARIADYFPDYQPTKRHLQIVCGGCPALLACRAHAKENGERGIWGGRYFGK